jgi:nucleoside-diphosphate-sugar epimerase
MQRILIIGAGGQIGTELYHTLSDKYGKENVVASDLKKLDFAYLTEELNVLDNDKLLEIVNKHKIDTIFLLAALLSATAEKNIDFAWKLNMEGLFNVLNLAKDKIIEKVYWPSSIAVFGSSTPRHNTPQHTVMEPETVYGISKQAGERWCEYYHKKFGVDVRSLRYPGLISYTSPPGGGTTDYAVDIFYSAVKNEKYLCFLKQDTELPMMYMEDAIRATIELMEAPAEQVKIRSSYNLAGFSFTPQQIFEEIKKHKPNFQIEYNPDFRQKIADSWPASIDDSRAQGDWNWKLKYDLSAMTKDMLKNLSERLM